MTERKIFYKSFLVRMWRESGNTSDWLLQVEHIPGGEKQFFYSLEELFRFISEIAQEQEGLRDERDSKPKVEPPVLPTRKITWKSKG
ncbi:MAG: hypothetical protein ACOYYJ_17475 [Chloroflexota bacterium]